MNKNLQALGCEENAADCLIDANLPVQAWRTADGGVRFVYYLPRKERCYSSEENEENHEVTCRNTARLLRNLADLFDAFSRGEIDSIYYPDKLLADAIADKEKRDSE